MPKVSFGTITLLLVISWFFCGSVASLAGFGGLIYSWISVVLVSPLLCLITAWHFLAKRFIQLKPLEKTLVFILLAVWAMHMTGILVPETGFDAVWYHLPVVKGFVEAHGFVYIPELYQSLNPLFSDSIFMLGYQIGGELGAKFVAYGFGLTLVLLSYQLARHFMARSWALVTILLVSTFQVVTWQSSSFYIDIAKAVWELAAVWLLLKTTTVANSIHRQKYTLLAGLFLAASLASKLFSFLLLPVFWIIISTSPLLTKKQKLLSFWLITIPLLLVALPFYIRTYVYSGPLLLSGQIFFDSIPDLNSQSSMLNYVVSKVITLPSALLAVTLARDYVSILFLACLPIFIWHFKNTWRQPTTRMLLLFSVGQLLLWWFIPPLSSRYALAGFVTLTVLYVESMAAVSEKYPRFFIPLVLTMFLAISFNLAPRGFVLLRNIDYIQNQPSRAEYVSQFYDGWIDSHLQKWHQLD